MSLNGELAKLLAGSHNFLAISAISAAFHQRVHGPVSRTVIVVLCRIFTFSQPREIPLFGSPDFVVAAPRSSGLRYASGAQSRTAHGGGIGDCFSATALHILRSADDYIHSWHNVSFRQEGGTIVDSKLATVREGEEVGAQALEYAFDEWDVPRHAGFD